MKRADRKAPGKRPYAAPRLVVYGDVTRLTQSRQRGPRKDGGSKGKTRTT